MTDFNTTLHRKLKNGLEFNGLFPNVNNAQSNLGIGDTFHTVKSIKTFVEKYFSQCEKIAKVLQRETLKETTEAIYSFLYNHIQYKQDNITQVLHSPANSWKNRATGIDCKSYSIFASCILTSLKIKHFIRQIKQPTWKPHLYTHVYVVVPFDQVTGNLESGYYIIDATVSTNREPIFIKKDDTAMSTKLPHIGLNGAKKIVSTKKRKAIATRKKPVARKKNGLVKPIILGLGAVLGLSLLSK